jgi:hydroxyacylglutathione hydrolase
MPAVIHRLFTGAANSYLIPLQTAGYALVDAGQVRVGWPLLRWGLRRLGLAPDAIKLIIVTHAHFDHVGGLAAVQQASGAPVIAHPKAAELLATGTVVIPSGQTPYSRFIHRAGTTAARIGLLNFPEVSQVIHSEDDLHVDNFGLNAQVIHTPGHTDDSLTVLCDDGRALVGDLAANHFPLGRGPILPPFFGDRDRVYTSWRRVLAAGARRIYPGHGRPFDAALLHEHLDRR